MLDHKDREMTIPIRIQGLYYLTPEIITACRRSIRSPHRRDRTKHLSTLRTSQCSSAHCANVDSFSISTDFSRRSLCTSSCIVSGRAYWWRWQCNVGGREQFLHRTFCRVSAVHCPEEHDAAGISAFLSSMCGTQNKNQRRHDTVITVASCTADAACAANPTSA